MNFQSFRLLKFSEFVYVCVCLCMFAYVWVWLYVCLYLFDVFRNFSIVQCSPLLIANYPLCSIIASRACMYFNDGEFTQLRTGYWIYYVCMCYILSMYTWLRITTRYFLYISVLTTHSRMDREV